MAINTGLVFLIIAIIAMVVGPIMMLQPNAGQRRQERLRNKALVLGMRVKIVTLPKQATDSHLPSAIPMYCLPYRHRVKTFDVSPWLVLRGAYVHESHFFEQWVWHGEFTASPQQQQWLRQHLASLPRSVAAVGCSAEGICVYWAEAGGEAVLEELVALLATCPAPINLSSQSALDPD